MTDAARLDFDSNPTGLWFRNFPLHQLKGSFCVRDLDGTHFVRHTLPVAPAGPASTPGADRSKVYQFSIFRD